MRVILPVLILSMCLTGCMSVQAQKQASTDAAEVRQVEGEQKGRIQELSPQAKARIEAGIRKYLDLPASTVLSDWHVSGEVEIDAVIEATDKHNSQQVIREKRRFSMGQHGMLTVEPSPR